MLSNVNTHSQRQCLFAVPEDEKQPSEQLASIQQLYLEKLLPQMQNSGQPFIKVSRKEHSFLENSIWVDFNGNIFEQYH